MWEFIQTGSNPHYLVNNFRLASFVDFRWGGTRDTLAEELAENDHLICVISVDISKRTRQLHSIDDELCECPEGRTRRWSERHPRSYSSLQWHCPKHAAIQDVTSIRIHLCDLPRHETQRMFPWLMLMRLQKKTQCELWQNLSCFAEKYFLSLSLREKLQWRQLCSVVCYLFAVQCQLKARIHLCQMTKTSVTMSCSNINRSEWIHSQREHAKCVAEMCIDSSLSKRNLCYRLGQQWRWSGDVPECEPRQRTDISRREINDLKKVISSRLHSFNSHYSRRIFDFVRNFLISAIKQTLTRTDRNFSFLSLDKTR